MVDVSIIIPTFNRLWCLPRAIGSCRGARCATEIIVVDDGSSDGTWEWLLTQADVKPLRQPNQGQTWAINIGFAHSSGRYIRFLDSDDFLRPGYIDLQFEKAVESGADLVYSRVDLLSETTKKITEFQDPPLWDDFIAIQLGEGSGSHFSGMLFRREVIEKIPRRPDFAAREDRMFLLEVALLNPRIALVPGCAGYWVQHDAQMQANYSGMKAVVAHWTLLGIYRRILGELERRGELTLRRKRAAIKTLWPLAHWIAYTHVDEACDLVRWIHELDPGFQPPESGFLGELYRRLGFRNTERVLGIRRAVLRGLHLQ